MTEMTIKVTIVALIVLGIASFALAGLLVFLKDAQLDALFAFIT